MNINTIEQKSQDAGQNGFSAYRSLEKALDVLELFTYSPILTVTEISKRTGYPKSTVSGLLKTFCKYGIIEKGEDKSFRLGVKTFELGFKYLNNLELYSIARLWAEKLAKEENEAIHVAIRRGTDIYIIIDVQPPSTYMAILQTGMSIPAHSTALGKVLLAHLDEDELSLFLQKPLQRLTEHTITSPERLRSELLKIKTDGYAVDNEESIKGLVCISAPIFQRNGQVIAAISISSMNLINKEARINMLIQKVKLAANNISMDIGFQPVNAKDVNHIL
ncbi:MAG: IclR family transcriptional regulator [bacterium]